MDKTSILMKYGLWEKAQNEIQTRKIDKAPYDMEERNNVYCELLNNELVIITICMRQIKTEYVIRRTK